MANYIKNTKSHTVSCKSCSKSFSSKVLLNRHMKFHDPDQRSALECWICSKILSSQFNLKRHLKLHDNVKQFQCKYCKKEFIQKVNMKQHEEICLMCPERTPEELSNSKKFICNVCAKNFRTNNQLKVHTLIHDNLYPHTCQICLNKFRHKRTLELHTLTHTNDRLIYCCKCGKGFLMHNNYLAKHIEKCFAL